MNGTRSRPSARSAQLFRSWLCSSFLKYNLHPHTIHFCAWPFCLFAHVSPCVIQVLGFSNLALRDPWPTLERSLQAYIPSYSLTLRYGLAATLWLCIGLLQVQLLFLLNTLLLHFSSICHPLLSFSRNEEHMECKFGDQIIYPFR